MERKSRYSQSSTKGTSPGEAKKNQDVVNGGKVFPKTSRRRESSGANGYAKNEQQSGKSNVQKARSFDKRPKPKGQYHGGAKEDTKVEEEDLAEIGSVMVPGSKKQNLNHLLNFHYAPREATSRGWNYGRSRNNYNSNNRWLPPVQRHKYNKEQFLQANCQFVVNNNGDYNVYLANPDILVEWNLIEQIRIYSSGNLSCPICLCPPVAAKMTRCGHVYCWPCILHYLALSDKPWRKCPICYETVQKKDLKSVVEITQNHLNIGDQIKLRLMRRERGSLIAVPVSEKETEVPTNFITVSEANSREVYSKLLLASISDVMDIIESERVQLNLELMDDPHSPENCFVEQALTDLSAREQNISLMNNTTHDTKNIGNTDDSKENEKCVEEKAELQDVKNIEKLNETEVAKICTEIAKSNACDEAASLEPPGGQPTSKFFYFYQAEDGQHLYLHAMNVKMLELQYGSLENSPRTICGKILEKEAGSFTEELRRRMRYLHHLPITSTFEVAEIELGPPLINDETLAQFAEQMENRERRRRKRDRDEKKREKKITAEENKRMGKFPSPKIHIESHKHFPQWQPESHSAGAGVSSSPTESVATSSVASSPSRNGFLEENDSMASSGLNSADHLGPSFAEMLQNKGPRACLSNVAWPSVGAHAVPRNRQITNDDEDDDTYTSAPSYNQSFYDDLAQALNNADLSTAGTDKTETGKKSGKRKKKCKTTILFATGMSRAS